MYDYSMKKSEWTIKEKLYQMFFLGLSGTDLHSNPNFVNALKNNLGGVIFFTQNILESNQFINLINEIKDISLTTPFLSIDQEGGRVERTLNIHGGNKYLNARDAAKKGPEFVKKQTEEIAKELKNFGINMNFAPVLDVDTNPDNPIIAERSYSPLPDSVAQYGKIAVDTYITNGIIPVGKHFPGHGETAVDSHKDMPELTMTLDELEKNHIYPFKKLINIPAVMAAHIHYSCFDNDKIPASISSNVIEKYLREKLRYNGLIISDDMVMGGIRGFSSVDACIMGINAGINMFIFRNSDDETMQMIETLVQKAQNGIIDMDKINFSLAKISELKNKFNIQD